MKSGHNNPARLAPLILPALVCFIAQPSARSDSSAPSSVTVGTTNPPVPTPTVSPVPASSSATTGKNNGAPLASVTPAPLPTPTPSPEKLTKKEAGRLFEKALALQQGTGCVADPAKARELYFRAARAGDPRAMQNLGVMLLSGAGVPADAMEGYRWIRQGADAGDPKALFSCALLLRVGTVTSKDPALAASMMKRAAEAGYVPALVSLADDSLSGENGATKDTEQGAKLLLRAAEAGDDGAAYRISAMYRAGSGFPKDDAKADFWLEKAARFGHPHAQFEYAHKMMVHRGPLAAYPWSKLSKEAGYVASIGVLIEIQALLTPEQIQLGDKEAAKIKAAYPPLTQ